MNLTKYHKKAIVTSILNDTPEPNKDELKQKIQLDLFDAMSPAAQALYRVTPSALASTSSYDCGIAYGATLIVGDADKNAVLKPYIKAHEARQNIKTKLTNALEGMRTRKQFIDAFPEFSHYAPEESGPTANLPALANIVADLVKAGWVQRVSQA